jgi:hypothetical protein
LNRGKQSVLATHHYPTSIANQHQRFIKLVLPISIQTETPLAEGKVRQVSESGTDQSADPCGFAAIENWFGVSVIAVGETSTAPAV